MTKITHLNTKKVYYIDTDADTVLSYILWHQPMNFHLYQNIVNDWTQVKMRSNEDDPKVDTVQVYIRGTIEVIDFYDEIKPTKDRLKVENVNDKLVAGINCEVNKPKE
jgi:hypothetical protein